MSRHAFDFKSRVALVTGGTSGLGKQIALGLAEAGADVVAVSRSVDAVNETALQISSIGRRTLSQPTDITRRDELLLLRSRIESELGPAAILVNCAGKTLRKPTCDLSDSEWDSVLDLNLSGTLRCCQVFYPQLCETQGVIVNVASLTSYVAFHQVAAYGASKAAVVALTQSLACEWAANGIRVNALVPGVFPTALNSNLLIGTPRGEEILMRTPMKRFGRPEEIVGAALFLCSDSASFVTGHGLVVDGGYLASGVNQN